VSTADAQRLEHVSTLTTAWSSLPDGSIGPDHIVLDRLRYEHAYYVMPDEVRDTNATVSVLDLTTRKVVVLSTKRGTLVDRFGLPYPEIGRMAPIGALVALERDRFGLYLHDSWSVETRRHWYAELDRASGKLTRSVEIGTFDPKHEVSFIGTNAKTREVWFYIERFGEARNKKLNKHYSAGPVEVTFRKLDLATLTSKDISVPLAPRKLESGVGNGSVHHAPDFSRFVIAEYADTVKHGAAPPKAYVVDAKTGGVFAVSTFGTTYGVAFSRDGRHIYLASNYEQKLSRVDIAKRGVDKVVDLPTRAHHAVVRGSNVIVYGNHQIVACDLTTLALRIVPTTKLIADVLRGFYGDGRPSTDGPYFVIRQDKPDPKSDVYQLAITRLVD
jgi:hypothetical protein